MVPIDSAKWTGFKGCIPTDHLDMTRAGEKDAADLDIDLVPFYRQLAANVVQGLAMLASKGMLGHGTRLADLHLPIRINGDLQRKVRAKMEALQGFLERVTDYSFDLDSAVRRPSSLPATMGPVTVAPALVSPSSP